MDWDKLKTFHAAAEAGSLTGAADALGISQSAVSRQIAALEEQLGGALFHRHPRGLQVTEQGRILHGLTDEMAARISLATAALADSRETPSGRVRITAPQALGTTWLVPRLGPFLTANPEIHLEVILDDAETELSPSDVEAAIRLRSPSQPAMIQRRLLVVRQSLYASHDYVRRNGAPAELEDLRAHPVIAFGGMAAAPIHGLDWVLTAVPGAPITPFFTVSSVLGVRRALQAGLGVGSLPDYVTSGVSTLTPVLDAHHGPPFEVYFVYPEELRGSRRIEVLRDFLVGLTPTLEG